jgi:hypothetical protein
MENVAPASKPGRRAVESEGALFRVGTITVASPSRAHGRVAEQRLNVRSASLTLTGRILMIKRLRSTR